MELAGTRVLITGANGFIGGRLAERLSLEEGVRVRSLMRGEWTRSTDPAPGMEIARGDVTDADALKRAVEACDFVVHCAAMQGTRGRLAEFRRVNVEGTLNLLRAARAANAARVIHLSTINVHGMPPPRETSADSPLSFNGDFYSVSKAEGERAAWQSARASGLPLVVVRPGCTYGPRSNAWTLQPLRRVRRGAPVLIGKGDGICNAVYIDNLVDLILLALKNDAAVGHAFVGAEGRGVTWREFYGAYARMLGNTRLNALPRRVALAVAAVLEAFARLDGTSPRLSRASVEFYSHRVIFDISKATKLLGYVPRVSFEEGMALTRQWLVDSGELEKITRQPA